MGNAIDRFAFRFRAYTYRSIRLCLADSQGVPATILICCAIDLLAKFFSGAANQAGNKKQYIDFLKRYFPPDYNAATFYAFVRCGLVHGFSLEDHYTRLNGVIGTMVDRFAGQNRLNA